jgi:type I restriction enzyme S subunit
MEEWKEYKLGELGEVVTGKTPSKDNPEDWGNLMPFITPSDYKNYKKYAKLAERNLSENGINRLKNKILPANSILVTCIGSDMGKVVINASDAISNQQINSIIPKPEITITDFLYYRLISEYETLRIYGGDGTAVPIVNKGDFENIETTIPPLPEQRAIASVLSSLDDKIDLLHRQNATLEKMAETLFRQWFVEEAKEEWETGTFKKWISETVGGEWGKDSFEGEFTKAVHCIRGTDIADLNIGLALKTPIRYIKSQKFKNIEPKTGDLIIEISGGTESQSTGRVCYINEDVKSLFLRPLVFSNFCRMIRIKKPEYSFFLYCFLRYLYDQDEFFNLENGSSGIKNLDYKALLFELEYLMPKEELVILFHKQVNPLYKKINQNKSKIRTLTQLRDTLLPKLMSGEVRVEI